MIKVFWGILLCVLMHGAIEVYAESNVAEKALSNTNTLNEVVQAPEAVSTNAAFWSWCDAIITAGRDGQFEDAEKALNRLKGYCHGKYMSPVVGNVPAGYYIHALEGGIVLSKFNQRYENVFIVGKKYDYKISDAYVSYTRALQLLQRATPGPAVSQELYNIHLGLARLMSKIGFFGDARGWAHGAYQYCPSPQHSNDIDIAKACIELRATRIDAAYPLFKKAWQKVDNPGRFTATSYAYLLFYYEYYNESFDILLSALAEYGVSPVMVDTDPVFSALVYNLGTVDTQRVREFYDLMGIQLISLGRAKKTQEENVKKLIQMLAEQRKVIAECYEFPHTNDDIEKVEAHSNVNYIPDEATGNWWLLEEL